ELHQRHQAPPGALHSRRLTPGVSLRTSDELRKKAVSDASAKDGRRKWWEQGERHASRRSNVATDLEKGEADPGSDDAPSEQRTSPLRPSRPWYRKKRWLIPIVLLVLLSPDIYSYTT